LPAFACILHWLDAENPGFITALPVRARLRASALPGAEGAELKQVKARSSTSRVSTGFTNQQLKP
jgi:hypothetical protein